MTSAITNTFRSLLLDQLKEDIDGNSENYYIGLARADLITNPTIENSVYAQNQVRHSLQAVKALNNASHVIKNVTWSTGFAYEAYNDAISAQENFYVINSSKEVFLCIEQGKNAEGVVQNCVNEPFASHERSVENGGGLASDGKTFILEDLYKWRYLFTLSNLAYATYKTNQWIPVKKALAVATIAEEIEQYALQQASVDGEILSVEIVSGGSGYSATPDLTIGGDGTLADFEVTINNGSVVKVEVSQSALDASFQHGTGYRCARATLSAGNAVLRPIISPPKGTHDDPTKILKSVALMLQADFKSDEDAKIRTENDFYQTCLLRDLKKYGDSDGEGGYTPTDSDYDLNVGSALKILQINKTDGVFGPDDLFSNAENTIQGKVYHYDSAGDTKLYYYQDETTGFGKFNTGAALVNRTVTGTGEIIRLFNPDVDATTGDILHINNVGQITRGSNQTEDIRIVIQLG